MKKILGGISAFIVLLISFITLSNAETTKNYNNLFEYTIEEDNTIAVTKLLNRTTTTEVVIPEKIDGKIVTTITGNFAIPRAQGENVALKKITIPASVQSIGTSYYGAFTNTSNLEEIIVDSNSKYYCTVNGVLYNKNKTELVAYPANKSGNTYNIPNSVKKIKALAFAYSRNLDTVNIPNSVTEIERSCFAESSIKSITIPESVNKTNPYIFYKCPNLVTANINNTGMLELNMFEGCKNLTTVRIGLKTTSIRSEAFKDCIKLSNINLESTKLLSMDNKVFQNCISFPKTIKLPNTLICVNKNTFDSNVKIELTGNDYIELTDKWSKCLNIQVTGEQDYKEAYKIFDIVNEERKKQNLQELKLDKTLTDIAMQRAYEISVYYAHRRPETYRWFALGDPSADAKVFFEDTYYRMNIKNTNTTSGENIAYGQSSSKDVMTSWMNSTGHRANILSTQFKTIGIGAVKVNNRYFWVQFFGDDATKASETNRNNNTEMRKVPVSTEYISNYDKKTEGFSISRDSYMNLYPGNKLTLSVKSSFLYANANTTISQDNFKWSSSNTNILTVDQKGVVTAVSPGTAKVTITMVNGDKRSIDITVNSIPLRSIELNKKEVNLKKGDYINLYVIYTPSNTTENKNITWTSSNTSIATVDSTGKVTAKGAGIAYITAKTISGITSTCKIIVQVPTIEITKVNLNRTELTINKGSTAILTATITPSNTTQSKNVTWTSSNTSIATVDETGKVTSKGTGTTYITVRTSNGKTATCKVTVPNIETKIVPNVNYRTHVENIGWQGYVKNGTMSGTSGRSLRLEAINVLLENNKYGGGVSYQTHIQNVGWQSWKQDNQISGTSGRSLRLEAIRIKLTGNIAKYYDIYYRVHCQNFGWLDWAKNGESAGSAGYSYRLEGIQIILVEKGKPAPGSTKSPFKQTYIRYQTHIQNIGWQSDVKDGGLSGTSGRSLRLEGIKISLENQLYSGGVEYQTHVQNIGWQKSISNGAMAGTSGRSLKLEAIRIKLTGDMAKHYDIYYRVHCQNFGWLDWAKNGESAGSAGYSYRLEGIQIILVEKGKPAPGSTKSPFKQTYIRYQTHIQNIGWQSDIKDGGLSGTSGRSLRLEGIRISLENQLYSGGVEYQTHVQNIGWQKSVSNGTMAGTSGRSLRLEAIRIKLTGDMSKHYDIYYRVHCQNLGWLDWAKNGESAGSAGYGYRLEAIQMILVKKGDKAPGNTTNHFKSK